MKKPVLPSWIWPDYPGGDLINAWVQCRHVFELGGQPGEAWVQVTADQSYRLFVNGTRVHEGPVRGMPDEWFYDRIDIAAYLRPGRNVIAALAHNPGLGHHSYIHSGFAGFLLWGFAGDHALDTGVAWKVRKAPEFLRHQTRLSLQLGWQEFFDARAGDGDWTDPAYNDSAWKPIDFWGARPKGSAPWHLLQERDVPLLREALVEPREICAAGRGPAAPNWEESRNVTILAAEERKVLRPARISTGGTIEVAAQDASEVQMWVLDLDQEVLGTTLLEITGATGGEWIDVNWAEACVDGEPALAPLEGCHMALGHRFICRTGDQTHESFAPLGGRFLVIGVHGATAGFRLNLRARHREYPFRRMGRLETTGTRFGAIYELCAHTQQLCASDTYIDCPGREQAMWWGDIVTHYGNSQRFAADDRLLVRGMRLLGRQRLPNGLTYSHAPTKAHECVLPDFTLAWIRSHRLHYEGTGRTDLILEHRDKIKEALGYFEEQAAGTGLLAHDPRYWLFLDWAETFKDGISTLYNLEYLETLEDAAYLFKTAGLGEDAAACGQRAVTLRGTIAAQLWDASTGEPLDGISWTGERIRRRSLHCLVRAILLGWGEDQHERWAREFLLPFVRGTRPRGAAIYAEAKSDANKSDLTPYFMHFTFLALTKLGHEEAVLDCIHRWWGDMLDRDLRTTEEIWDAVPGIASLCHAWTAHPVQHMSNLLLGIRQAAPGWRKIIYRPVFHGESARGVVDTPQGPVHSAWRREGTSVICELEIPEGLEAEIQLAGSVKQVTGPFAGTFSV